MAAYIYRNVKPSSESYIYYKYNLHEQRVKNIMLNL